jgi:hypothetical protein
MQNTQRLESWLAAEVSGTPTADAPSSFLSHLDPLQRTRMLYDLLDRRPALAAATRRLALYDQLRLSVELVRGATSAASAAWARCYASPPGARRRPQHNARRVP